MPHTDKDKLHRFQQKMRDEGADGFADGPRPWEHWDESGNQASSRVWEGSARRVNGNGHSFGSRLLSFLAFVAFATLLVGIGGVYYTHTRQVADSGEGSLPVIERPESAGHETVVLATAEPDNLNVLTAPAAGKTQPPELTPAEADGTETSGIFIPPPPAETPTSTPAADSNIESVAIETIVTEQSVTTTVYTRHPHRDEPVVVAAIETTPPPFVHEVVPAPAEMPEPELPAAAEPEASPEPVTELVVAAVAPEPIEVPVVEVIPEPEPVAEPVVEATPEPEPVVEPAPVPKTGKWVVNLSSYTWRSTANKKLALFASQGVEGEVFKVMIKDKPMYRIRVTGYKNSRAAKAAIPELEEKLDLEGAWISKR